MLRPMFVRIHFHGAIDRRGLEQDQLVELPGPATVETVLRHLGYSSQQQRFIIPMVAGERRLASHVLNDGDQLDILTPFSGG